MDPEDGRVVSNFIVQSLKGEPLTIYGQGTQTRSFCFLDDMVAGLVALMHTAGDLSQPVNLGNPGEFTMLELAEMVLEETGSDVPFKSCPLPEDDPKIRRPDITRAQTTLGWEPRILLRDGLRLTIPYFAHLVSRPTEARELVRG